MERKWGAWTDAEVEACLERETRALPDPDGGRAWVTTFRLHWNAYDLLTEFGGHRPADLVALARAEAERSDCHLEEGFRRVVAQLSDRWRADRGD